MNTLRIFLLGFLWLLTACNGIAQTHKGAPKNVIIMIPDGFGPASVTFARDFKHQTTGVRGLAMDQVLVGTVRTFATDSRVTDSAAGATAYACGVKTYNGAIGVDASGKPCATLFEAAERKGMRTGVVVTTRLTHATPAAFSAHVPRRASEEDIAAQQIDTANMDVVFGGGGMYFTPKSNGGNRADERDLVKETKQKGYAIASDLASFSSLNKLPALAIFARDHMAYEVDRNPSKEPSLAEMTQKALSLLNKNNKKGFVLMVEGSRIDHAAHGNDAAGHVHDILAFDAAMQVILDFAKQDGQTLVVSVADHETGGLTLGRNLNGKGVYAWKPENLAKVDASLDTLTALVRMPNANIKQILAQRAGIADLTEAEHNQVQADIGNANKALLNFTLAEIIAKRSIIAWTTDGHTAVDVDLYAFGPHAAKFRGNHDNTDVGNLIAQALGFNLKTLTAQLFKD